MGLEGGKFGWSYVHHGNGIVLNYCYIVLYSVIIAINCMLNTCNYIAK